jgi:NADPH-dependent 2,4-dienoyl-CoA reductase/sulfur reductase-like enzyme/rhodanese-related sulfurtransferase
MKKQQRALIVGGVAGGASCAARLRRLNEDIEIVLFDRGPYVSFANCGLPYYVGDVIDEESKLLVATPELFARRFNIEVRTENEVTAIDAPEKRIEVRDLKSGREYSEDYDFLVLAPGASPIRPPLPGIELPGIFFVRTIPDSRRIKEWIVYKGPRRAVVVGGGFIGIEMAENLAQRGLNVAILEAANQLLPPMDPEMSEPVCRHLESHRIDVRLGDGVLGFEENSDGSLKVNSGSGSALAADLVIFSIGIKPETALAVSAGLKIGRTGGIWVDGQMRTSIPGIWAVGDAVEARDAVLGGECLAALAGPANRQGRIAAESICGRDRQFRGVQGTAVCGFFDYAAALTGASEKALRRAGITDYEAVYLHPGHHVGYYPGAEPIHLKLIFAKPHGQILGAQAVGARGVAKRIDVISMAIQKQATVFDLEESELCYAPQFGAAKDPVNMAGMVAANFLRGDLPLVHWTELPEADALILDVRDTHEFAAGNIEGAVNIPLGELRQRVGELPRDREILVHCEVGQRSYYAIRFLLLNGYRARMISGGYQTYWGFAS